ncbi:hypothetical protein SAMN04487910_3688 [Aquimarina amphilecti]|uniref:Glutaminyl-tRNA synthetase n=1 Tax=Aquimarina amphilecti TaxID=1038014 RepID=A0A1H7UDF7_AQUAM|nr:DUF6327 family protein [Aquimarina amphilecti]SEL95001.1 hypothetical protein SAMN04487910_3688 [Aquimarina amphilecti]
MKKTYTSFKEIENDLRRLNLQRQISLEEMKLLKSNLKEDIQPYQWFSTVLSAVKKYGILYLIKRMFK